MYITTVVRVDLPEGWMTDKRYWAANKTTTSFLQVVASGQRCIAEFNREELMPDLVVVGALIDHMYIRARGVIEFLIEGKSGDRINRTDFLSSWTPPNSREKKRLTTYLHQADQLIAHDLDAISAEPGFAAKALPRDLTHVMGQFAEEMARRQSYLADYFKGAVAQAEEMLARPPEIVMLPTRGRPGGL